MIAPLTDFIDSINAQPAGKEVPKTGINNLTQRRRDSNSLIPPPRAYSEGLAQREKVNPHYLSPPKPALSLSQYLLKIDVNQALKKERENLRVKPTNKKELKEWL